jgi:hypothetical protein
VTVEDVVRLAAFLLLGVVGGRVVGRLERMLRR